MDSVKKTPWKFITVSVGFHLLIGGLVFYIQLRPSPPHSDVAVMQVSLVDPVEIAPATTNSPQPIQVRPRSSIHLPVKPEPLRSSETVAPESQNKDTASVETQTAYEQTVQVQQEEELPPSTTASLLESSQARQEKTGVDSSRADELTRFLQDVRNRLEQAKRYPWLARIQGQEGTVRVQFMIDLSGEAHEIRLLESSRSKILDQEAVETVKRVGRFSHLPVSWNKTIQVNVPLVFQLNPP